MSVIDNYLNSQSGPERLELERICKIVRATVPEAKEVITYQMPGFKYKNKYLLAFAVFKEHIGLFPTSGPIETLKDRLGDFKTSKGGIQFTPSHSLPDELIKEILRERLSEINGK